MRAKLHFKLINKLLVKLIGVFVIFLEAWRQKTCVVFVIPIETAIQNS